MEESIASRSLHFLKENGVRKTIQKSVQRVWTLHQQKIEYNRFLKENTTSLEELEQQKIRQKNFEFRPCISIVVPLFHTKEVFLRELLDSVVNQTYDNWQLCLADGSGENSLEHLIHKWYPDEGRIVYRHLDENYGIAGNTNAALEMATGNYIALGDHDDTLTPDALFWCVEALNRNRDIDCMYSDEDKLDANTGRYFMPHFKSDFNLDLLRSHNYITHLFVFSRALYEKVGGFQPCFEGAQDYDLILRCVEQATEIYHIPKVLYHWRSHENSTSSNPESKTYTWENGRKALQAHFDRLRIPARAKLDNHFGFYRVEYLWPDAEDKKVEIISVGPDASSNSIFDKVKASEADFILFLSEYIDKQPRVLTFTDMSQSVKELMMTVMREDVSVVGGKVITTNDKVRHGLRILNRTDGAKDSFTGLSGDDGYFFRNRAMQDVSVVSAECMMVAKEEFLELGGFSSGLLGLRGEDYCLRVLEKGKRVVYNPFSEWTYRGYSIEGVSHREKIAFYEKWKDILEQGDFCYNVNLDDEKCRFNL